MQRLNQPPPGSHIQLKQTDQQIRIRLPDDMTIYLLVSVLMIGFSVFLIRQGLNALQTESIQTGAVLLPWVASVACLAIAGLSLVSRLTVYVDPPTAEGNFRLQWVVAEVVIEPQTLHLQLLAPFRRRWVHIPLTDIYQVNRVDEEYWALGRRKRDRYCILRTNEGDYVVGSSLQQQEQEWFVTEVSTVMPQLRHWFSQG